MNYQKFSLLPNIYNELPKIFFALFDSTLYMTSFGINKICGGVRFYLWGDGLNSLRREVNVKFIGPDNL